MKLRGSSVPAWPLALWLMPGLAVLVAVVVTGGGSPASPLPPAAKPLDPAPAGPDDPRAVSLLLAAQRAATRVPYSGVQYVSLWCPRGATSQVVDVTHVPGTGSLVVVKGTPAAPRNTIFTADRTVHDTVTRLSDGPINLLAESYHIVVTGEEEVAGRPTMVIEARRASGAVAARLWLDKDSNLVLRRELFDRSGATTKAAAFVDVTIGRASLDGKLPVAQIEPMPEQVPLESVVDLREGGWVVPAIAAGLELTVIRRLDNNAGMGLFLTYTDGLSTVSVFQQRGHLDAERLAGFSRVRIGGAEVRVQDGIPYQASWSADGLVYTVIGDAPAEVVEGVIAVLPHESPATGVMARLGQGADRMVSWLNPFR
jgi:sigma-E factor negative regulatory protein RseB